MHLSETILLLMLLLAIGMISSGLFRKLPIPYTVLLVCIGLLLKELTVYYEPLLGDLQQFKLTPELVLFIFLPTLIFESGFNLNARQLLKDLIPVITMAVPALLLSTLLVGLGVWLILPVSLAVALLFGALISATDPVAVIALFKEIGTPQRLTVLVEGESLFNDATAIVVFKILLGVALYGSISWADSGHIIGEFIKTFIGGLMIGILFGLLMSWLLATLKLSSSAVLILSLVLAYSSFIIAEHSLHLSGVMAAVGAAITLGGIAIPRLAHETVEALSEIWEFLALICNTLLFLLVGLSANLQSILLNWDNILMVVALIIIVRAILVYSLLPGVVYLFKIPQITLGEQHIMSWGGLKGGLAIAMVLSIPEDLPGRALLLDITVGVVLFTLLVNAPTIKPLIHFLGIDRLTDDEKIDLKRGMSLSHHEIQNSLQQFMDAGLLSKQNHQTILHNIGTLSEPDNLVYSLEQNYHYHQIHALQIEKQALENLYRAGIVPNYCFHDLRAELTRAKEHILNPERRVFDHKRHYLNPFVRIENSMIQRLREQNWATGLLSHYQNTRLYQHLTKDFAHLLMIEQALHYLANNPDILKENAQQLTSHYSQRAEFFRKNIDEIKSEFPDYFSQFEIRLCTRGALFSALSETEKESFQGSINAKPKNLIATILHNAIDKIPSARLSFQKIQVLPLLSTVPLFKDMDQKVLEQIAHHAQIVHFLSDDIIVNQGEKGDALYIIASGRVSVKYLKEGAVESLNELVCGNFFGELALLGDHVRLATVRAIHACTLLRLTRKDVLQLANKHTEIAARLEQARKERSNL